MVFSRLTKSFARPRAVALIVGSCCPVVHYGFGSSHPVHRTVYLLVIGTLGLAVMAISFTNVFNHFTALRISLFVALGLSGVVALVHAMVAHDFSPSTVSLFKGVLGMGATYIAGIGFYATRFPEAVAPRRFDIIGSSHQLWHVCVLLAAYTHFKVVHELWLSTAMALPLAASVSVDVA